MENKEKQEVCNQCGNVKVVGKGGEKVCPHCSKTKDLYEESFFPLNDYKK